jgi:hypothetical protein
MPAMRNEFLEVPGDELRPVIGGYPQLGQRGFISASARQPSSFLPTQQGIVQQFWTIPAE